MTRLSSFIVREDGLEAEGCFPAEEGDMIPEEPGDDPATEITEEIFGIGRAVMQDGGTKPLEEHRPDEDVGGHFPEAGRLVVGTKAQPSVEEQVERQRDGDEEAVVEVAVKYGGVAVQVGLDELAVDEIGGEAEQEDGIAVITEIPIGFSKHRA